MNYLTRIRLLVNCELTLRYRRSVIEIGWAVLNPVLTSVVRQLTDRAIWLENGYVKMVGKASDVVDAYEAK